MSFHKKQSSRGNNVIAFRKADRDPVFDAIGAYWKAIDTWRQSRRRLKRLKDALPADVTRRPRVQVSRVLKGRNEDGSDIFEPIYAHSDYTVIREADQMCKSYIDTFAHKYKWVLDDGKTGKTVRVKNADLRTKRKPIRAKWSAWKKQKLHELAADREMLYKQQRAAGWYQAVEAEGAAETAVSDARHDLVFKIKPVSFEGAAALLKWIYDVEKTRSYSSQERAPYGLGEYYMTRVALTVAKLLNPGITRSRRPTSSAA